LGFFRFVVFPVMGRSITTHGHHEATSAKPVGAVLTDEDVAVTARVVYRAACGLPDLIRRGDRGASRSARPRASALQRAIGAVIEAKLDEVVETNEMMLKLLEQRGIDPKGGGSRNH